MPTTVPIGTLITPGGNQGPTGTTAQMQIGGRLKYVSATALSYLPFNGSYIQINGQFYQIPPGGIAGLANTSVYIEGVVGNLVASSLYRIYCFNNAGTLTAEFSSVAHATSQTAGNIGTEIKSGDDSRTLIGMVYTNASSQFVDAPTQRWTRSWLNGGRVSFGQSNITISVTATTSTVTAVNVTALSWAGEAIIATANGYGTASAVTNVYFTLALDGTGISVSAVSTTSTTAKFENWSVSYTWNASETLHTIALYANVSAANTYSGTGFLGGLVG